MRLKSDHSRTRTAYALYLMVFTTLYSLFLFFELRKGQYIHANALENTLTADQYHHLLKISTITTRIEYLLAFLFLICLMASVLHKRRGILIFIKVHYMTLLVLFPLGYLLSLAFSTPFGNSTQALVLPFSVTTFVLVLFAAQAIKKRLSS